MNSASIPTGGRGSAAILPKLRRRTRTISRANSARRHPPRRASFLLAEIDAATRDYLDINKNAGTDSDRMERIRAASKRLVQAHLAVIRRAR